MGDNIIIMSPGMMDQSTDCNVFFMFSSIFVIFFGLFLFILCYLLVCLLFSLALFSIDIRIKVQL